MRQRQCTLESELFLSDCIKELNSVNKKLAILSLRKEELVEHIVTEFDHKHEGQKTYEFNVWKVEIKTPVIYSLDKKLYESGECSLPSEYNPIKESISYTIDKRLCDEYIAKAPKKVRDALAELIEKKPGKPSINIKERV